MTDFKKRLRAALKSTGKIKYKKGGYIKPAGGGDQVVYGATHAQGGVDRNPQVELEGGGYTPGGKPKAGEVITTIYDNGGKPQEFYMSHKNGVAQQYLQAKAANGGSLPQEEKQEFAKLNESMNPDGSPQQVAANGGMKEYMMGGALPLSNEMGYGGYTTHDMTNPKTGYTISAENEKAHNSLKGASFTHANGGMKQYFMGGMDMSQRGGPMHQMPDGSMMPGATHGETPQMSQQQMRSHGGYHSYEGAPVSSIGPDQNQSMISQGKPAQSWGSKAWEVMTNPGAAFSWTATHDNTPLPDYFSTRDMSDQNIGNSGSHGGGIDFATSFVNPAAITDMVWDLGSDIKTEGMTKENMAQVAFMAAFRKRMPKGGKKEALALWNKQKGKVLPAVTNTSVATTSKLPMSGRGIPGNPYGSGSGIPTVYNPKGAIPPGGGVGMTWKDHLVGIGSGLGLGAIALSEDDETTSDSLVKVNDTDNSGWTMMDDLKPTVVNEESNEEVEVKETKGNTGGGGGSNSDVKLSQQELLDQGYELPNYGADGFMGDETQGAIDERTRNKTAAAAGYSVSEDDLVWNPDAAENVRNSYGTDKGGWMPKEGAVNTEFGDTFNATDGEWNNDATTVGEGEAIEEEGSPEERMDGNKKTEDKGSSFLDRIGINNITDGIEILSIMKADRYAKEQNKKLGELKVESKKITPGAYTPETVDLGDDKERTSQLTVAAIKQGMQQGKSMSSIIAAVKSGQKELRTLSKTESELQKKQNNFAKKMNMDAKFKADVTNMTNDRQDQIANNDAMASMFKNNIALSQNMRNAISTKIKDVKLLNAAENEMMVINEAIAGGTGTDLRKGIPAIRRLMGNGTVSESVGNELITNLQNQWDSEKPTSDSTTTTPKMEDGTTKGELVKVAGADGFTTYEWNGKKWKKE